MKLNSQPKPKSSLGFIIASIVGGLIIIGVVIAVVMLTKKPAEEQYPSYLQVWVDKYGSKNSATATAGGRQLSLLWRNKEGITTKPTVVKYQTRYRDTSTSGWSPWLPEWTKIDSSAMKLGIAPDSAQGTGTGKGSYNYATVDVDDVQKAYDIRLRTQYADDGGTYNILYPLSPSTITLSTPGNTTSQTVNGTFHVDYTLLGGLGNYSCDGGGAYKLFPWAENTGAPADGTTNPTPQERKNYIINGNQWSGQNTYGYIIPSYSRYDPKTKTWYAMTFANGDSVISTWAHGDHKWLANNAQTSCWSHGARVGYTSFTAPIAPMEASKPGKTSSVGYDKYYTDSNNNENVKYRIGLQPEQIFKSWKAYPIAKGPWLPITITIPEVA